MGLLYNLSYEYDEAAKWFTAALKLRSGDYGLWNKLGATLANGNRSRDALGAYEKALSLKPSYVRARANLGIAHLSNGDYGEAAKHFVQALRMHPDAAHIWSNLEMVTRLLNRDDLAVHAARKNLEPFKASFPLE